MTVEEMEAMGAHLVEEGNVLLRKQCDLRKRFPDQKESERITDEILVVTKQAREWLLGAEYCRRLEWILGALERPK